MPGRALVISGRTTGAVKPRPAAQLPHGGHVAERATFRGALLGHRRFPERAVRDVEGGAGLR